MSICLVATASSTGCACSEVILLGEKIVSTAHLPWRQGLVGTGHVGSFRCSTDATTASAVANRLGGEMCVLGLGGRTPARTIIRVFFGIPDRAATSRTRRSRSAVAIPSRWTSRTCRGQSSLDNIVVDRNPIGVDGPGALGTPGARTAEVPAMQNQPNRTRGYSRTPEYIAWRNMRARCRRSLYFGRGITVCSEWTAPVTATSRLRAHRSASGSRVLVDWIDNDGNYEPGNIRWATPSQQMRNRRRGPEQR